MSTAEPKRTRVVRSDQATTHRSVRVGAPGGAESLMQVFKDEQGNVTAVEIMCVCGEHHRLICEYTKEQS